MCLVLDQFLWGHSSRVCDISCFSYFSTKTHVGTQSNCLNVRVLLSIQKKIVKSDGIENIHNFTLKLLPISFLEIIGKAHLDLLYNCTEGLRILLL